MPKKEPGPGRLVFIITANCSVVLLSSAVTGWCLRHTASMGECDVTVSPPKGEDYSGHCASRFVQPHKIIPSGM